MYSNMIRPAVLATICLLMVPMLWAQDSELSNNMTLASQQNVSEAELTHNALLHKAVTVSFNETSVEQALKTIAEMADLKMMYNKRILPAEKMVSLEKSSMTLNEALWTILDGTGLRFAISSNRLLILLEDKEKKLINTFDLQDTLRGTVVDAQTGEALPGVNIIIEGTTTGTTTNVDGEFEFSVPSLEETLVFSYIGYQSLVVAIDGRTDLTIELRADVAQLDDLVVVGYGEQRRRDLTGSISSVSSSQLEGQTISSIEQGLQGQVAGLNVTSGGGRPGGEMIVRIRGNNSIVGGNDPLYVIDGIPVRTGTSGGTSMMAMLDTGNIESIDILKDASATAIYGSRGSNGVIIITTRQGRADTHMIDIESSIGFQKAERTIDMLNSSQMLELVNERAFNDGRDPFFSPSEVQALSQINTDWVDEILRTAPTQNYTLRFSGGDETTRYVVAGNYYDQEGIVLGSDFNRGSLRINLDQEISPRLNISARTFLSRSERNAINENLTFNSALFMPPWHTPYDDDGNYTPAPLMRTYPFSPASGENVVALVNEQLNHRTMDRIIGNVSADYNFMEYLTYRLRLGIDYHSAEQNSYNPRVLEGGGDDGSGSRSMTSNSSYLIENTLTFQQELRENDRINIVAGFTWEQTENSFLSGSGAGFITDDLQSYNLGAAERYSAPNTGFSDSVLLSGLARVNYAMNDRYLFTVSARADGSSRFGQGNKWGYFPSGAFTWVLSEENFIRDNFENLSNLRMRFSYGISGNQAISPYQSLQRYVDTSIAFGGTPTTGFLPQNLGNPNLKWETTEEVNVGLEIGLWDQRLQITSDYYVKNTSDLLAVVNVPPNVGFNTTLENIGSTRNRGVEFDVDAAILRGNVNWNLGFNVSANRNVVTETADGQDIVVGQVDVLGSANIIREGEPLGAFYGLELDDPPLTEDGFFNFVDQTGDGQITGEDRVVLGSPYPDFVYGFNTQVNYRNFQLRATIQGEYGALIYNSNRYFFMSSSSRGANSIADVHENRWSPDNPDRYAKYPRSSSTLNQNPSDWMIEDGSYLRLQNVQLTYYLPQNVIDALGVRNASLSVQGQNLYTFTGYSWYSPDVNTFSSGDLRIGVDHRSYPTARTVEFSIRLSI